MRKLIMVALASALVAGAGAYAADPGVISPKEKEKLDKLLAGRTAGEPLSCVNFRDLGGNEGFGEEVIVFRGRTNGQPLYVNNPPGGCPELTNFRALKVRTPTTRLCRGDIVTIFDPVSGQSYGGCGLGDFVPYTKAKAD